jgi:hypothetical protein
MSVSSSVNSDKYYLTFNSLVATGNCNNLTYNVGPFFQRIKNPKQRFRIKVLAFAFDASVAGDVPDMLSICIKQFNSDSFIFRTDTASTDIAIQCLPRAITGNTYPYVSDGDDGGVVGYLSQLQTMTIQFRDEFIQDAPAINGKDYILRIMVKPIPDESNFSSNTL